MKLDDSIQVYFQVNGLAQGMVALNARIISARSMITNKGEDNDVRAVSDYYLGSGDKCGPQTITGWSQNVDYARTKDTLETGTRSVRILGEERFLVRLLGLTAVLASTLPSLPDITTSVHTPGHKKFLKQQQCSFNIFLGSEVVETLLKCA